MEAFRQILSQLNATFSNLSLGKKITMGRRNSIKWEIEPLHL